MSDAHNLLIKTVKEAFDAGLCVVSPAQNGSKRPKPGDSYDWSKYQSIQSKPKEHGIWYKDDSRTGIGIVTGKVSGNLEALDFDDPALWEPFKERAMEWNLDELLSRLIAGYCEKTPGGAYHILYRCEVIGGNQKLASRPKSPAEKKHEKDSTKTCIETRGEGGYIIIAPTYGTVHETGKPYELISGGCSTIENITPEDREALLDLACSFHVPDASIVKSDLKASKSAMKEFGKPGNDFIAQSTWAGVLEPHGWKQIKVANEIGYWQKPGGKAGATHATTNYAGSDLLYVFSTATDFQPEKGYSKFAAYTVLNHKGDYKAAAKALAAEGYGSSVSNAENVAKSCHSQAEAILELASCLELFHDQNGDGYYFYNGQCQKLQSKNTKKLLSFLYFKSTGRTPKKEALNEAIATLEGNAIFDREERHLENRVATHGGDIIYDLGNHLAVLITKYGWKIINAPQIFRRFSHQAVQVTPISGGDANKLFDFINVAKANKLLVLVTLISFFVPGIPHPIFHPWGPQGSGKTSLFKAFKKLVDPSIVETLMSIIDRARVIHALVTHYMPLFDNLSRLDGETSDILCQACTGGGIEQRQLYTDSDSIIFQILRCIGVNGINLSVIKADILDRTLLLHLLRIPPSKRREDSELWAAFEIARPYILGGVFDILSKAMAIYPTVKLDKLPRLADYGRWGYAIAEAIEPGFGKKFIADYELNVQQQVEEAIASNTLAVTLLGYMDKCKGKKWETTIDKAFSTLKLTADTDRFDKSFPATSRELRRHLERLKSTLEERGLTYEIGKRTATGYPIEFCKLDNFASPSSFDSLKSAGNVPNECNESNTASVDTHDYSNDL